MNVQWYMRSIVRRLNEWDLRSKIRFVLSRHSSRRVALVISAFLFIMYCLFSRSGEQETSVVESCLQERLRQYAPQMDVASVGVDGESVDFIGNGHQGVGRDGELRFWSTVSHVLDSLTGFYPLVNAKLVDSLASKEAIITDFENGVLKKMKCFQVESECGCVVHTVYAHRTKPRLLVEDIQIINPTRLTMSVDISRRDSPQWTSDKGSPDNSVVSRVWGDNVGAVVCSSVPGKVSILQKREESLRFICASSVRTGDASLIGSVVEDAVKEYTAGKSANSAVLDRQHADAWKQLGATSFHISYSHAPNVLNGLLINATRYALLSNSKAPLLEDNVPLDQKKTLTAAAARRDLCYTGHSTLLFPSRLWEMGKRTEGEVVSLCELWLLTLEKRGCSNVMRTGASGIAYAFVLSLSGGTFHDGHLEVGIEHADLHREMSVRQLAIGDSSSLSFDIRLADDNRPYLLVSSSSELYACGAGCADDPIRLGAEPTRMAVRLTRPLTSILYVAPNRKHLTDLKSAIHISDVEDAPPHGNEVIALHKHGARLGGLPSLFWVVLVLILIAFHVFLIKLLYSEWRKGDTTPYNPYLRQRYSYIRQH